MFVAHTIFDFSNLEIVCIVAIENSLSTNHDIFTNKTAVRSSEKRGWGNDKHPTQFVSFGRVSESKETIPRVIILNGLTIGNALGSEACLKLQ